MLVSELAGAMPAFQRHVPTGRKSARTIAQEHANKLVAKYGVGKKESQFGKYVVAFTNGECLAFRLVRDGYAVPLPGSPAHMFRALNIAKHGGKGLWADGFISPDGEWTDMAIDFFDVGAGRMLEFSDEMIT